MHSCSGIRKTYELNLTTILGRGPREDLITSTRSACGLDLEDDRRRGQCDDAVAILLSSSKACWTRVVVEIVRSIDSAGEGTNYAVVVDRGVKHILVAPSSTAVLEASGIRTAMARRGRLLICIVVVLTEACYENLVT